MPIANATKLGPYEIVEPLGAGGMGEVYLARDTRLGRTVAVKVLPESLAGDPDRLQRFEQEARVLSTFSHPNLLNIYDVGAQSGIHFLVSEFLEGHTLRERMTSGSLSQRKLPDYAMQLANGLAAAHDKGIVHRDLKPENIFITNDDRVKILDFGLAKQSQFASSLSGATATITTPAATTPGTVLGTVGYMSPEQVRGDVVDHRSDIFSFGAILYEIVSGYRAFKGSSGVETMNAILKEDPPEFDSLQTKVSPAMNRIIRHCLEKNPANRFQSARDLAFALGALSGTESNASGASTVAAPKKSWWIALPAGVLALALLVPAVYFFSSNRRQQPERLEFAIPLEEEAAHLALSSDGRMLAYVSPDSNSGSNIITVQRVGSGKTTVLPGTEGASYPFWSPDDAYVAFFADGKLKKVPVSGGAPQVIANAFGARGGSWSRNGVIVYSPAVAGWLWSVNADGSNPSPITDKFFEIGTSHRWPLFLPDGDHFLFWSGNFTNGSDDRTTGIYMSSLSRHEKKLLLLSRSNPGYANGSLFFIGERGSLRAVPIDLKNATVSGETRVVAPDVGFQPSTYWGSFAVAENGTLVYNSSPGAALSAFSWFDRSGKEATRVGEVGVLANPTLSPDDSRLAFDSADVKANNVDVWVRDLRQGNNSRFTFSPAEDVGPVWSRDGNTIAFRSNNIRSSLYLKPSRGLGEARLLATPDFADVGDIVPSSWSPDGSQILCVSTGPRGSHLILVSTATGRISNLFASNANESNGQISPDGKWVAYASNETGEWEIYVTTFPTSAGKWQVSHDGGTEPRWRGDGREIFYLNSKGMLTAVSVSDENTFSAGNPAPLFQSHARAQISSTDLFTYDVTRDGRRFLMNRYAKPPQIAPLHIILNSTADAPR